MAEKNRGKGDRNSIPPLPPRSYCNLNGQAPLQCVKLYRPGRRTQPDPPPPLAIDHTRVEIFPTVRARR